MSKKSLKNSNKSFGILFFIVFTLYGIWPLFISNEIRIWSLVIGVILLILGLINSKLLTPMNLIWIKFGEILGRIVAPIVMSFIYFIIITPIGLFMRLAGKDLLRTKFLNINSYWIKRRKNIGSMKKQF
tara:strand:+ start:87 stop:473 length:387 start_codon:yes stop_codon:yes gene_type:complete